MKKSEMITYAESLVEKHRLTKKEFDLFCDVYINKMTKADAYRNNYNKYHRFKGHEDPTKQCNFILNKTKIKEFKKDVYKLVKRIEEEENYVLTIHDRKVFLSRVVRGKEKEPKKSPYQGVYQSEASVSDKLKAISILNEYDVKKNDVDNTGDIVINVTGKPIKMTVKNIQRIEDLKVEEDINKSLEDVM